MPMKRKYKNDQLSFQMFKLLIIIEPVFLKIDNKSIFENIFSKVYL